MNEIETLKKTILEQYPRLGPEDTFKFGCHPGISCFNSCCSDVNIFLTPYDVLRLKKHLDITSKEFLDKYTQIVGDKKQQLPAVQLRMKETEMKECHFVHPENGCTVYSNRPWSCRMYPVGQASPKETPDSTDEKFYFILKEDVCHGFEEPKEWTVKEWLENQGVADYDKFGELFKDIAYHDFFDSGKVLTPQKVEMYFLALYNLDHFRDFIFKTTFLDKFEFDEEFLNKIKEDDEELLMFGITWLKFALFGEKTMKIKNDADNK